jgi:hypothetical protein
VCPQDPTKTADLDYAVSSHVAWLADTCAAIKAKRPHATLIIGGLSSRQAQCWTLKLGHFRKDARTYRRLSRRRRTKLPSASTQ